MKKFLILICLGFLFSIQPAFAATGDVEGYAWGGGGTPNPSGYDGIGWISMSSTVAPTYALNIPSSGNLSGYAWSEHYGWISFNVSDVVGCPGGGTCNARRVGDNILGWARIISICDTGNVGNGHIRDGHCDANDDGWNAGGWNGWVSLSGGGYGLEVSKMANRAWNDTVSPKTYAYSDELGWIDFSMAGFSNSLKICPNPCNFSVPPFQKPGTFSSVPTTLYACYGPGSDCSTGSLVPGTWIESNPTPDAISLSTVPSTPATSTTVSNIYTGATSADEDITLTYTPPTSPLQSVTATARVSCVPLTCSSFSAQTITYCPKDPERLFNNGCGSTVSCPGTKSCNYDWTEGTP